MNAINRLRRIASTNAHPIVRRTSVRVRLDRIRAWNHDPSRGAFRMLKEMPSPELCLASEFAA